MIHWHELTSSEQIDAITEASRARDQLIFKHSTRCSISAMALEKFESVPPKPNLDYHKLLVVEDRPVSLEVAQRYDIIHQSPQILQIRDGECIMHTSHWEIEMARVMS